MKKGSYIDTQGMSGPADPDAKPSLTPQEYKPMIVKPRRLFTPEYVKELKILLNEVLDERQYQKELSQAVDNPTPPGISYFDVDHFKHSIDDPEPDYPLKPKEDLK